MCIPEDMFCYCLSFLIHLKKNVKKNTCTGTIFKHSPSESQGLQLRRLSMVNTWYFRFRRECRLSVHPSGHDFYVENVSFLEANFGWQEV